jgi:hypothetical protein
MQGVRRWQVMPATDDRPPGDVEGAKRSAADLLAEADRLLEELPERIEAAKRERERAARLRTRPGPPAASPRQRRG